MIRKAIALTLSLVVMAGIFAYMAGVFTPDLPQKKAVAAPIPSEGYVEVSLITMPQKRVFSGTVQAHQSAALSARINARVADVLVDAGDSVKAGDILIRLENEDLSARVIQQQQALASAQARVNDARLNDERVSKLVARGLLPVAERDATKMRLETANADLAGRRASLSEAEVTRGYSVITAPFDGVIRSRDVDQGDIATVGGNLVSIYNPNMLRLEAAVSESVLSYVQASETVDVVLDASGGSRKAQALEIEPAADAASRSFTVKFGFEDKTDLYPGMFGRVAIPLTPMQVLAVPESAVVSLGQLRYVNIKQDESKPLERRIVRLGEHFVLNDTHWVVISSGLNEGEWIHVPR